MVQQALRDHADIGTFFFTRTMRTDDIDRCRRIHDSKYRTIGVDKDALDAQLREKKTLQQLADDTTKAYDEAALRLDRRLQLIDQERRMRNAQRERDLASFRSTFQASQKKTAFHPSESQTIDLQAVGVSAAQKFDGEDEEFEERRILQQKQQAAWVAQQAAEKQQQQQREADEALAYSRLLEEQENIQRMMQEERVDKQKQRNKELADELRRQAEEKRARKQAATEDENNQRQREIDFMNATLPSGELEAESEELARLVREAQAAQREEAERLRMEQREAQRQEAEEQAATTKGAMVAALRVEAKRAAERKSLAAEALRLAAEKAERDALVDTTENTFYTNFGRTHR